ncbi:hypothetical protein ACFCX4_34795 [Kitasatospora sp. NPDC056327]|uniref:hypothetical protein n=1 Tax=Kitasatospora sp. NPDC056327 TaxID=3345785 RepID=UPI0035D57152
MLRSKRALGAGLITVALAAGAGWAVQADAKDITSDNSPARDGVARVIDGYQIVQLPNENVGNFERRTVSCPSGKRAVGGGAEAQGEESVLNGSFPTDDGTGWIGLGHQPGYDSVGISVHVVCVNF